MDVKWKKGPLQRTIGRRARRGSGQDVILAVATITSGNATSGSKPLKARSISVERVQVVVQVAVSP